MILFLAFSLWVAALSIVSLGSGQPAAARRERLMDLAAVGLVGLGTLGFFWRLVFSGNVWMPAGGGDLAGFIYPTYRFAAEWWRRGVIPLWNPYLFAGQPFVGDIQSGILYPLNLLTFFASNPLSYRDLELLSVLHYFIAGAGMYALLRWGRLGRPGPAVQDEGQEVAVADGPAAASQGGRSGGALARMACLLGALAFEYSDLFVTHFGNLNLIASAAWLPLVFLFFKRALDESGPVHGDGVRRQRPLLFSLIAGILLALSFLAGHIQSFVFVILAILLYAAYRVLVDRRRALYSAGVLAMTLFVGLGLSAPILFPGIEMTRASVRSSLSYESAAQYSLPPAELVGLVIPGFFGRGPEAAWAPWDRVEVGYLGVLPLMLAGLALVLRRDRTVGFFALLALVGLGLALGGYAILHGWLYAFAPGLGQLRAPARFIYLLDFGFAVLAAIGCDILLGPMEQIRQTLGSILRRAPWVWLLVALVGGGGALALLALGQGQDPVLYKRLAGSANAIALFILLSALSLVLLWARERERVNTSPWGWLALGLAAFDLFSLGANVDVGLSDPTANYNRADIVEFLQSDGGIFRIDSRGTGVEASWLPDTALLYGLFDVNGDNPLVLSGTDRYLESVGSRDSPLYRRLNAKYVLAKRQTPLPANFKRVFDGSSGVSVWENQSALPRARVVYSSMVVANAEQLFATLNDPAYDPQSAVLLEEGIARAVDRRSTADHSAAKITAYGPNEIDLDVGEGDERYLVLSEVYYPGWRALVDGRETRVLRADFLFRAIALPPGAHRVRFIYDPFSFKLGGLVAGLTALSAFILVIYLWRRNL